MVGSGFGLVREGRVWLEGMQGSRIRRGRGRGRGRSVFMNDLGLALHLCGLR